MTRPESRIRYRRIVFLMSQGITRKQIAYMLGMTRWALYKHLERRKAGERRVWCRGGRRAVDWKGVQ